MQNLPYCSAHRVQLPRNERRSIANSYTDWEMSVVSTYLNSNAQTLLGVFVVDILYNKGHFADFAQNWLQWQRPLRNQKNWSRLTTFTQIPSIWWEKNPENRPNRSSDSFAQFKKRKKRKIQEALLLHKDRAACLSVEILQLQNIPFENDCNRQMTLTFIRLRS